MTPDTEGGSVPPPVDTATVVATLRAAGCVFAEEEAQLLLAAAATPAELVGMLERRVAGLPLEHVIGWAEFCGLRIAVDPGVFVPRRRTELLVHEAISRVGSGAVVVDLCCGSGAVAAAIAAEVGGIDLHASDVDPGAVRCARRNLAAAGGRVHEGDLFAALPVRLRGRIQVLVANVPYVPTAEIELLPREARLHEPRLALDGGVDGLDVLRRVSAAATGWLAPGGHLLVETSDLQAPLAADILAADDLMPEVARDDDLEATVVIGERAAGRGSELRLGAGSQTVEVIRIPPRLAGRHPPAGSTSAAVITAAAAAQKASLSQ